nr:uncharacterized protein LOC117280556 [Nicotiana tomentosiformis]
MHTKATRFSLSEDGNQFIRSFDYPFAICLRLGDTEYILRKIHEGTCGNHSGTESSVRKVIRVGYYWIDMESDAREFIRKCNGCQRYTPMIHQPGELLHSVLSPWPFMKWGMDIIIPLTWAPTKSSTRVTPFSLVYGTEALILVEVGEPSIRFQYPTKELNDEAMNTSLELLDERCEAAIVRLASQKQLIEMYYNRRPNF